MVKNKCTYLLDGSSTKELRELEFQPGIRFVELRLYLRKIFGDGFDLKEIFVDLNESMIAVT